MKKKTNKALAEKLCQIKITDMRKNNIHNAVLVQSLTFMRLGSMRLETMKQGA